MILLVVVHCKHLTRRESTFCCRRACLRALGVQVETKDYDLASTLERELANFMRKNRMNFEDDGK